MRMTTIIFDDDGASSPEPGAVDPFQDIRHLLPKLKKPSWVRLIGKQRRVTKAKAPSREAAKVIARKERKRLKRLGRALAGEHTRVASAAA